MTNVSLEPGDAGTLEDLIADTDDGLYLRDQPLVVDRRPPPAVPVRDARSRGRSRAASSGGLRRNPSYAGVTPAFWGWLDAVRLAPSGALVHGCINCGKGEPGQVDARLARHRPGALPRRPGRRARDARDARSTRPGGPCAPPAARRWRASRQRALAAARFARSRPTQATDARRRARVEILCVRDGHTGRPSTNRTDDDALAAARRARAHDAARAAAARARATTPGFPSAGARRAATTASTPPPPRSTPPPAAPRCAAAFAVAAERAASRRSALWTAGDVEHGDRDRAPASRARDRVTDALHEGHLPRPDGRSGYAAARPWRAGARSTPRRARRARPRRRSPARGEPRRRCRAGEYPVVLEPDAVGELLDCSASLRLQRARPRRGPRRARRTPRRARRRAGDQPRRLARFPRTLPRAFDAEGVPEGAAAADPGRRRPPRRPRHALAPRAPAAARPRPATRIAPGGARAGPIPTQPRAGRRRRRRRGRARGPDRARHLRDAPLVREPGAAQGDAAHRRDARRHVPDRGRPHGRARCATCASPTRCCACSRPREALTATAAPGGRGRVLRAPLRHGVVVPGAARATASA